MTDRGKFFGLGLGLGLGYVKLMYVGPGVGKLRFCGGGSWLIIANYIANFFHIPHTDEVPR
jgi:hypothetical protein